MSTPWPKSILVLYILIIAGLTLIPGSAIPEMPQWGISWDKLVHFAIFGLLVFLVILTLQPHPNKKYLLGAVTFSILYGLLLETAQIFVPGRFFSWPDVVANSSGAVVTAVFLWLKLR